jgi:hypothetical protein
MAIVRCDVCGGTFSQRHLASHKRLAHTKIGASAASPTALPISEKGVIQKISSLYESLSVEGRKRVMRLLAVIEKNGPERPANSVSAIENDEESS